MFRSRFVNVHGLHARARTLKTFRIYFIRPNRLAILSCADLILRFVLKSQISAIAGIMKKPDLYGDPWYHARTEPK